MTGVSTDNFLARRAADGDQHAFGQLVQRHGRALAQAARSFGIPETDIDDVVQDTFIAAWHALDEFDEEKPFRPWLFRIGLNKMRDLHRFRRVRHFFFGAADVNEAAFADAAPSEAPGPEREIGARRELAHINRILGKLDRASREVIILTSFLEMSHPEAACALDISPKAVESRVTRARARLAALLKANEKNN
ncbi:RNA polymerase sigma factor [Ralstonia mannitolilytica]|uniref:RNA polymerase sigma factor n=1 Tax=Ralstonia mannitolilytica TaxID=105219 RepID=UPI0005DA2FB8|nr:sigma-70 family RNA polymerase sigma factor [Ralstonia mannitolilytica]AJW47413.1 RNA polymerase sigma factor [Ralstonia mannitolilytica]